MRMSSLRWNLTHTTGILIKRGNLDRDLHREKAIWWNNVEKMAVYKPRRKAWNTSFHHSPQKKLTLVTSRDAEQEIPRSCPPNRNKYSTAIYKTKCLSGSSGIQGNNPEETDKFLETGNLTRLNHKELENLKKQIKGKDTEWVIKNPQEQMASLVKYTKHLKTN